MGNPVEPHYTNSHSQAITVPIDVLAEVYDKIAPSGLRVRNLSDDSIDTYSSHMEKWQEQYGEIPLDAYILPPNVGTLETENDNVCAGLRFGNDGPDYISLHPHVPLSIATMMMKTYGPEITNQFLTDDGFTLTRKEVDTIDHRFDSIREPATPQYQTIWTDGELTFEADELGYPVDQDKRRLGGTILPYDQKVDIDQSREAMELYIDQLKVAYPELGLSFGYLGNMENWGDDRSWYVFTKTQEPKSHSPSRKLCFGGESTKNLPELKKRAATRLHGWVTDRVLPAHNFNNNQATLRDLTYLARHAVLFGDKEDAVSYLNKISSRHDRVEAVDEIVSSIKELPRSTDNETVEKVQDKLLERYAKAADEFKAFVEDEGILLKDHKSLSLG